MAPKRLSACTAGSASNAWAVAGGRSASGAPLLASDPHLGYGAPILWYLARIELPGGRVLAGATAPGVPGIVIGRNERLAWGFTTTHSDTQDVFVERLAGPDAYLTPDGARPFTVRDEVIRVRFGSPVAVRVRETRHGPVLSDLDAPQGRPDGTVLAVAMANLLPGDTAAAGLLALNRASGIAEARAAARLITSPSQNLTLADADGGIAMFLTGRTPIRRAGDGSLPVPGWDDSHGWTGFVPFDALPHVERPASGILAHANSRTAPPDHPVFLGRDWFGDWRLRRIGRLSDEPLRIRLFSSAGFTADSVSQNVIGEVRGSGPDADQVIVIGGHLDSWDLGTGAIDDGAGVAITAAALKLIEDMPRKPRRTIRVVWWGSEEVSQPPPAQGLAGARHYAETRREQAASHVAVSESDFGAGPVYALALPAGTDPAFRAAAMRVLTPLGIYFDGEPARSGGLARAGCRSPDPQHERPRRGGRARPPAGHRGLREAAARHAPPAVAHQRPGKGRGLVAPTGRCGARCGRRLSRSGAGEHDHRRHQDPARRPSERPDPVAGDEPADRGRLVPVH